MPDMTNEDLCEGLIRNLEVAGDEMLEKHFVTGDGRILASVFAIVGPHSGELAAEFRRWASEQGFRRTS